MKEEHCVTCGKRTSIMYKMNAGVFCQFHYEAAYFQQETDLRREALKEELSSLNK